MATVASEIVQVISECCRVSSDDIKEDSDLRVNLGCDSLDLLELEMLLEEEFDLHDFDTSKIEKPPLVGKIIDEVHFQLVAHGVTIDRGSIGPVKG